MVYNPYRQPAERKVIRKVELTSKEIRTAIARFIEEENLIDGWCDDESLNFFFQSGEENLVKPVRVTVYKEEKIPSIKY